MTNTTNATAARTSVTGMRLAHRMMTTDLDRLARAARSVADGASPCSARRATALAAWLADLSTEIHHHHEVEDDSAWPVIAAAAGGHVDLGVLTDDHRALDPMLERIRAAAAVFVAAPDSGRAAAAAPLAEHVAELRDHLAEHIAAEEASLFPVIERYVPATEWARVEEAARNGGTGMAFTLPRAFAVVTDAERAELFGAAGAGERLMLSVMGAVLGAGHRRRERLVFG